MAKRSVIDRARVIDLAQRGKGKQAIMRETGLSAGFVQKWMHRSDPEDLERSGRPRKATQKVVSSIRRIMYGRRRRSLRHVVGILKKRTIANVSHETVRKAARAAGLKPYKRPTKPRMSKAQRAARVRFALQHANYDWRRVFFSDETTIVTHGKPNRQIDRIWVHSADEVPPVETQKYSSYVKFWGGIGYNGKSALVVCNKPFNSKEYIRVLKRGLVGVDAQYDGPWELQRDGDPAHTSAETLAWLARRNPPISVLEGWPSGSPDASVIENAWPVLKDNIAAREPRSKKDLIRIAKDEWSKLDLDFCRTLIDSMPRRLLLIRRAKGGPISY